MLDPQSLPAAEAGSRHVKQGDQSGPTSGLFLCLGLDCWVRGWVLWRVLAAVEPAPSLLGSECRRRWTTTLSSVCRASSVHHALSFVWMASLAWTCFETLMRYESRLFCSGGSVWVMPVVARVVSLGAFLIGDLACRWVIMSVCLGRWWSLAEASRRSKSLGFAGFYFETWLVSRLEILSETRDHRLAARLASSSRRVADGCSFHRRSPGLVAGWPSPRRMGLLGRLDAVSQPLISMSTSLGQRQES